MTVSPLIAIDTSACIACGACVGTCPRGALSLAGDPPVATLDTDRCVACGACVMVCPVDALSLPGIGTARSTREAQPAAPTEPPAPTPTSPPPASVPVSTEPDEPAWSLRAWRPGRGALRAQVRRRLRQGGGRRP